MCPERLLIRMAFSDAASNVDRILRKTVEPAGVVHDRRQLVIDCLQIGLGVRIPAFTPVIDKFVLPPAHHSDIYVADPRIPEEGEDL